MNFPNPEMRENERLKVLSQNYLYIRDMREKKNTKINTIKHVFFL